MAGRWVREIPIELIDRNPEQPRAGFELEELKSLADSIRMHGVLQPIMVQPGRLEGRWQLISGERRLKGAKLAGLETIPSIVSDRCNAGEQLTLALVENIQRTDLDDVELAHAFQRMSSEFGQTQEEISNTVGKSRSHVANTLRLLELSGPMQEAIREGKISPGHARALLMAEPGDREHLFGDVLQDGLNVRQTENAARSFARRRSGAGKQSRRKLSEEALRILGEMEKMLETSLNRKVRIVRKANGSGTLNMEFYSDKDLEALVRRFREIWRQLDDINIV